MSQSAPFQVEEFVFDPRPNYPLLVAAKRYRLTVASDDPRALTIILTHGTGFHKEQWEPAISDLCEIVRRKEGVVIRELWSLDCPNHGESAVLNEATLQWGYDRVFGWAEYGRAVHLFLTGHGTGIPTDFKTHRLIGIGHSMGAVALDLSLTYPSPPHFETLILVEPMMMSKSAEEKFGNVLSEGALARRDVWPSKEDAYGALSERKAFKVWDARVLRAFCEHGLRDLPTVTYPDKTGVTLKCTKTQEAACYHDWNGRVVAYNFLAHACKVLPVHVIFGSVNDYTSASTKEDVIKNGAKDLVKSVRRVEGAGHLIVQTHPTRLAEAIFSVLSLSKDDFSSRSKL